MAVNSKNVNDSWATDTTISRPEAAKEDVMVDFGAFGWSMDGMVHNMSESDVENLIVPTFSPEGYLGDDVTDFDQYDDEVREDGR